MSTLREAAQQALEALESLFTLQMNYILLEQREDAISALKAALEQPKTRNQCGETCERVKLCAVCARGLEEPVAWLKTMYSGTRPMLEVDHLRKATSTPVYTAPPRCEWPERSKT